MMKLTTLPNGLRVASRFMPSVETAAVGLYADTGSRYEPAHLNGIAHLFEHMVFKGAGGRSAREISEAIEDVGGDLNASTDRDGTNFMASVMAEHVPLGLELIADMILRPHFSEAELEREKDVVLQELGEARDTPSDIIFDDLQSAAFADQPLGRSVLGEEASIEAIKVEDLTTGAAANIAAAAFRWSRPGRSITTRWSSLPRLAFADLPGGTNLAPEPAHFTGGDRVGRTSSDQAHLALGFRGRASSTRIIMRALLRRCGRRRACPRACSSSCARIAASPTASMRASARGAMRACSRSMRRPRAASRPPPRS
jgi:predicted Zn-dependent peptidase